MGGEVHLAAEPSRRDDGPDIVLVFESRDARGPPRPADALIPRRQRTRELRHRLPPLGGVLRQRLPDCLVEPASESAAWTWLSAGGGSHRCLVMTPSGARRLERRAPGDHLEDDDAEAVDVRSRVERLGLELLGRRVQDRPHELRRPSVSCSSAPSRRLARPKSITLKTTSPDSNLWLTMFPGFRSRCTTPASWASRSAPHSGPTMRWTSARGIGPPEASRSRRLGPFEVLHDQVRLAVTRDGEIENGDDVRVAQLRAEPALAHEALPQPPRVSACRPDDLDDDLVAEMDAAGAVDLAHPAGRQQSANLVSAVQGCAGRQHDNPLMAVAPRPVFPCGVRRCAPTPARPRRS